jgi:hypothetical protein
MREKLEEFLGNPPEMYRESAYCIVMYPFGHHVFPADTGVSWLRRKRGLSSSVLVTLACHFDPPEG